MPTWEMLNRQDHGSLRVSRKSDAQRHFAQIVPAEFLQAAPYYAILFTKHPDTGAFYAGVVMGLEPGENLLVLDETLPDYRPADLERRGFFTTPDGIAIERDDPVFADPAGQTLFGGDGEPALALRRVQQALHTLEAGLPESEALIARLLSHRLLEPIDVKMDFDDGRSLRLDGLYTISLDALHALRDDVALDLFRRGDLQLAYAQTGSVRHLRTLGRIRNARL